MAFSGEDIKSIIGIEDIKNCKLLIRQLLAEFIGTFLYLSIVLYTGVNFGESNITTAFANGLLIASIVQIIGQISGGHINPAITVGALTTARIKVLKALLYIIAQILGAIAGSIVAYVISEESSRGNLGATVPFKDLSDGQVFGLEFLMTFVLVSVFLSGFKTNNGGSMGPWPLAIGLSITACQCSALTYTGSLNPVRSLGPAVVMDIWDQHWVYWAGPLLGGLLAGIVHRFVFVLPIDTVDLDRE